MLLAKGLIKVINMKIYVDNCCFNRPFDDQSQLRIKLESEAKLKIQEEIRAGRLEMVWSYIIDYENSKNPFAERKKQIVVWKKYAIVDIQENTEIIKKANSLSRKGMRKMDSLHIACAIYSQCDYFLTTDDKVLKKSDIIEEINIVDPFGFIKEVSL
jgi:predicted nucleic acid-binding protein